MVTKKNNKTKIPLNEELIKLEFYSKLITELQQLQIKIENEVRICEKQSHLGGAFKQGTPR